MIRQICPHCFRPVELPDAAAGADAPCPACGKPIPVPGAYAPAVDPAAGPPPVRESAARLPTPGPVPPDRPPPPPGFVPPAPVTAPGGPVAAAGPVTTSEHSAGVTLSPAVLGWVPAGCFTLVFLLTFFSWVGTYPGGYRVYSQNGWETAFRLIDTNNFFEDVLKKEADLRGHMGIGWLLIPYLLGLVVLTTAAWAERVVRDPATVPVPAVRSLWRYRFALFAALAAVLLVFLALQIRVGFGLETAVDRLAAAHHEADLTAAKSSAERQKVYVQEGMEVGSYELQTTVWLTLAVAAHVAGLLAAAGRFWLDHRGTKPPPRLTIHW